MKQAIVFLVLLVGANSMSMTRPAPMEHSSELPTGTPLVQIILNVSKPSDVVMTNPTTGDLPTFGPPAQIEHVPQTPDIPSFLPPSMVEEVIQSFLPPTVLVPLPAPIPSEIATKPLPIETPKTLKELLQLLKEKYGKPAPIGATRPTPEVPTFLPPATPEVSRPPTIEEATNYEELIAAVIAQNNINAATRPALAV